MKQLAVWLPADLVERLVAHVGADAGRTQRGEVAAALEGYLAVVGPTPDAIRPASS